MRWSFLGCVAFVVSLATHAAEIRFDFSQASIDQAPPGFRNLLSGQGRPGEWKIILDEVPPPLPPLTPNAPPAAKKPVLAQVSADQTDERFPLLIYDGEIFGDFKLTTRFKTVGGTAERMAGVVFRLQDENNYYYLRASALGNNFRFFKVVKGQRSSPIGPEVAMPSGVWHELAVECKGNQILCSLNGKEIIPALTDNSFSSGKVGFWTKSDSVSHFVDARITYTPRERLGKALIREIQQNYPRLLGLKIYAVPNGKSEPQVIASSYGKDVGTPGGKTERDVIDRNVTYFGRGKQTVTVTLPLHDRNGDAIAAVRFTMKSFVGQTEQNAVVRVMPMIKHMESRIRRSTDLLE